MSLPSISPEAAKRLVDDGAVLVDVRGADEHARERIPGARNVPLDRLQRIDSQSRPVVFHCRTGTRTSVNAVRLADAAACDAYIVEGGLESWKKAGLPVEVDAGQPIEVMRQVQIAAGSLVLIGVALGTFVDPRFLGLSAVVGAGLVFAGTTGWCGMAKLLALMPWNRPAVAGKR